MSRRTTWMLVPAKYATIKRNSGKVIAKKGCVRIRRGSWVRYKCKSTTQAAKKHGKPASESVSSQYGRRT